MRKTSVLVLGVLLGALGAGGALSAQPAPLAGEYTVRHAQETGDTVMVHLAFRITNSTDVDVIGGRLSVRDSQDTSVSYGEIERVTLPSRRPEQLSGMFQVAAAEFARWAEAGRPAVALEVRGPDGQVQVAWIQLAPGDVQ